MKRAKIVTVLVVVALLSGCATKAVVAPVPGQINTFDAWAYRVLSDAQAAITAFKTDVTSGKVTETPAIRVALNQAITDYDAAEAAYLAWHAAGGTGATVVLGAQITRVSTDIVNVTGGVK